MLYFPTVSDRWFKFLYLLLLKQHMKKIMLGKTNIQVPNIVVGCMRINSLSKKEMNSFIHTAIDDEQAARTLCGKTIYVKKALVADNDHLAIDYFVGFDIVDKHAGLIGTISAVDDSTANALFAVGERLIPINETFIDDIDHDQKTLYMNLPEGLLSL